MNIDVKICVCCFFSSCWNNLVSHVGMFLVIFSTPSPWKNIKIRMYRHKCVCTQVYTYVCMYVCMYVCTYVNTHAVQIPNSASNRKSFTWIILKTILCLVLASRANYLSKQQCIRTTLVQVCLVCPVSPGETCWWRLKMVVLLACVSSQLHFEEKRI